MNALLFCFGLLITLVACGAVGGIWWAALRDGQTHEAIKHGEGTGLKEAPLRPGDPAEERSSDLAWRAGVVSPAIDGPIEQTAPGARS